MSYTKDYNRINWENDPSKASPINAPNLNTMDAMIDVLDDRTVELSSDKADKSDLSNYATKQDLLSLQLNQVSNAIGITGNNLITRPYNTFSPSSASGTLTITELSDGGIKVTGQIAQVMVNDNGYCIKELTLPAGKYNLSGLTGTLNASGVWLAIYKYSNDKYSYAHSDEGHGVNIEVDASMEGTYRVVLNFSGLHQNYDFTIYPTLISLTAEATAEVLENYQEQLTPGTAIDIDNNTISVKIDGTSITTDNDGNLKAAAIDLANYYDKSDVDALLADVDTALEDKADNSDLTGLATETYVDNAITEVTNGLSSVATSGSYNDLDDLPTIPSIEGMIDDRIVSGNTTTWGSTPINRKFEVLKDVLGLTSNSIIDDYINTQVETLTGITFWYRDSDKSFVLNGESNYYDEDNGIWLGTSKEVLKPNTEILLSPGTYALTGGILGLGVHAVIRRSKNGGNIVISNYAANYPKTFVVSNSTTYLIGVTITVPDGNPDGTRFPKCENLNVRPLLYMAARGQYSSSVLSELGNYRGGTAISVTDGHVINTRIDNSTITLDSYGRLQASQSPDIDDTITSTTYTWSSDKINTDFYPKSDVYTKSEVNSLLSDKLVKLVVTDLPTTNISTRTIYMKAKTTSETNNVYDEWMYINNKWEKIGDTATDLSSYYTSSQVDSLISAIIDDSTTSTTKTWSSDKLSSNYYTQEQVNQMLQSQVTQTQEVLNIGGSNLIPYPYTDTTKTENGITFTDNGDRTLTINGTATDDVEFRFVGELTWTSSLSIPLTHNYRAKSNSNKSHPDGLDFNITYWQQPNTGTLVLDEDRIFKYSSELFDGITFTDDPIQVTVCIFIHKGTVCDNITVNPELFDLDDTSSVSIQAELTAGPGITINSNTISAKIDSNTIKFNSNSEIAVASEVISEISSLSLHDSQHTSQLTSLSTSMSELASTASSLSTQSSTQASEISSLASAVSSAVGSDYSSEISSLASVNSSQSSQITSLSTSLSELASTASAQSTTNSSFTSDISSLSTAQSELGSEVTILQSEVASISGGGGGSSSNDGVRRTRNNITNNLTNLFTAIAERNLEKYGYIIGDYFVGASGYYYYLADMDCNYSRDNGYSTVSTHHCGVVVDTKQSCAWLSSGTVTNYSSSTLHNYLKGTVLNNIKSDFIALFGGSTGLEHLLARTELDNAVGGWGTTWEGLANTYICAMTEVQTIGARVFGCDGFQTGTGAKQLELFRKYRWNDIYGNIPIWLKSLFSSSCACYLSNLGSADYSVVSSSCRASGLILLH